MNFSGRLEAVLEGTGSLGYQLRGTQLDGGRIDTNIQTATAGSASFFRVFVDRRCLFAGPEPSGLLAFTLLESGDCNTNGIAVNTQRMSTYSSNELHVVHIGGALRSHLPAKAFRKRLLQMNAYRALDVLDSAAGLQLNTQQSQDYKRLHQAALRHQLSELQFMDFITALLENGDDSPIEPKGTALLQRLVHLAHTEAEAEPLSLMEVCRHLNIGKTTLSEHCRTTYGMGVMQFLRHVRLEQARIALAHPGHGWSVDDVRMRYRFSNRARFAANYQKAFGYLPSATPKRP
ncbi:helix-turn-helix transcriptional regulator [Parasynechococcus sp.]|uniref:helix-turn-helix transcriptional regulator n=1 Tax=Parasynechococcus sp. TaxID=3101203 RepID=UPI0037037195